MSNVVGVKKLTPQIARNVAKDTRNFSYVIVGRAISYEAGRRSLYGAYNEFIGEFLQVMTDEKNGNVELRNSSNRAIVPNILDDRITIAIASAVQAGRQASVEFAVRLVCKPHATRGDAREWTMEELGDVKMQSTAGVADSILARALGASETKSEAKKSK